MLVHMAHDSGGKHSLFTLKDIYVIALISYCGFQYFLVAKYGTRE